ncbi:MAG: PEGA domain-containing protein [Lacunisphaera sp.]|nr:PEGA domain-containing protein [Lacunisphaera sp.]
MSDLDFGATVRGFTPGQKLFGRYTLKKILGRGGMGVVWLAEDGKLDTPVALKFLPEVVVLDPKAMDELKREAKRNLQITHAHIVRIYDFVDDPGSAAIAMEFVDGHTLSKLGVERPDGVFTPEELKPWLAQLCDALAYAHEKAKIVHRDLKPANLMVGRDGDLKVTDFGIARSIADSVSRVSANAGTSGSPPYMSPQQLNGLAPKVTDDIYAVGATLYELLTGKPPFHSGGMAAIIHQIQHVVPPSVTERRQELGNGGASIPAAWESTIAACLAKEPQDRPQSMREFAARLDGAPALKVARAEPARRSGSTKNLLYAGIASAVLLLAGAGYYFGVQVPAQRRQMEEQVRLAAEQESKAQQLARERTEKEAAAEAKARTEREQVEFTGILAQIAAVHDDAPRTEFEAMERVVQTYLGTAPDRLTAGMEQALGKRRTAWLAFEAAHRPGSLAIETEPAGAAVTLYPGNERKTSPAVFKEIKPGEVSFRVEKEGYESQDFPYVIKPGTEHRAERVRLLATTGSVVVTSLPAGAKVSLDGNSRHFEGVTPFKQAQIPPGEYRVTFQRADWRPVVKPLTVKRNEDAPLAADLHGVGLTINSTPTGAQVALNGKPAGLTPLSLTDQVPGEYRVTFTREGYDAAERNVTAENNMKVDVLLTKSVLRVGTLVVYRPWRLAMSSDGGGFEMLINGQVTGLLPNGFYWRVALPVGVYDLGVGDKKLNVSFAMGQTVYVFLDIGFDYHLRIVDEATAQNALSRLKLADRLPTSLQP